MSKCDNKPYTIQHILDTDIDDLATIPDFFIGVRTVENPADGTTIATPVRIPGARVMPTGNLANVVALNANNTALEIPDNQVLAGYFDAQPGGNIMRVAGQSHAAQFMMLDNYANGKVLVQATGFLTFPNGHNYIPLQQYYLGDNGEPVTDSTVTGQKLFFVLDENTLNINGDF